MVSIKYNVTQQDYIDFLHYHIQQDLPRSFNQRVKKYVKLVNQVLIWPMRIIMPFVLIGFLIVICATPFSADMLAFFLLSVPVLLVLILFSSKRFHDQDRRTRKIMNKMVKRQMRSGVINPEFWKRHVLELEESSLRICYGTTQSEYYYRAIYKAEQYPTGISIYFNINRAEIIPISAFESAEHSYLFFDDLQTRISCAKSGEAEDSAGILEASVPEEEIENHKRDSRYVLECRWNEPDFIKGYAKASRLVYLTRLGWSNKQIALSVLSLLFLFGTGYLSYLIYASEAPTVVETGTRLFLILVLTLFIITFNLYPLRTLFAPRMITTRLRKENDFRDRYGTQILCVKEDKITCFNKCSINSIMFTHLNRVKQNRDYIYFLCKDGSALLIPLSAFASEDQQNEVIQFITEKMRRS